MADNFNMKQFLMENKLGAYSKLKTEGEAAYEYEKGKAAGEKEEKEKLAKEDYAGAEEEKMMDFLAEYEVIYVYGSDGKCYRKDDEGNYDEVNDYYCRMYAEGKKEKEEGYMGTQYDSSEDMAVDMVKKGITEKITPEAVERMEGLANMQDLATLKTKLMILASDWNQEGFEKEDVLEYIKHLLDSQFNEAKKEPTEEAFGGENKEGDALVLRFLQGVAKKFDYPVAKAAIFVKNTIKSLGY